VLKPPANELTGRTIEAVIFLLVWLIISPKGLEVTIASLDDKPSINAVYFHKPRVAADAWLDRG
jgi:hypothetical protein